MPPCWSNHPPAGEQHFRVLDRRIHSPKILPVYQDIVPELRIVYTFVMTVDGTLISVSPGAVELQGQAASSGTRLTHTEQGAYLDGQDTSESRKHGSGALLDALGVQLRRQEAIG